MISSPRHLRVRVKIDENLPESAVTVVRAAGPRCAVRLGPSERSLEGSLSAGSLLDKLW